MKFKIQGLDLHRIMTTVGAACAKNDIRPILKAINCKVEDNRLLATGCDGYVMHQVTVPVDIINPSNEEFNIPMEKGIDKKAEYTIEVDETSISYQTEMSTSKKDLVEGTYMRTKDLYPKVDSVFTIHVDPKLLANTLKSYGAEKVIKLEFYTDVAPIKFSTHSGDSGIVLPIRINKN